MARVTVPSSTANGSCGGPGPSEPSSYTSHGCVLRSYECESVTDQHSSIEAPPEFQLDLDSPRQVHLWLESTGQERPVVLRPRERRLGDRRAPTEGRLAAPGRGCWGRHRFRTTPTTGAVAAAGIGGSDVGVQPGRQRSSRPRAAPQHTRATVARRAQEEGPPSRTRTKPAGGLWRTMRRQHTHKTNTRRSGAR